MLLLREEIQDINVDLIVPVHLNVSSTLSPFCKWKLRQRLSDPLLHTTVNNYVSLRHFLFHLFSLFLCQRLLPPLQENRFVHSPAAALPISSSVETLTAMKLIAKLEWLKWSHILFAIPGTGLVICRREVRQEAHSGDVQNYPSNNNQN